MMPIKHAIQWLYPYTLLLGPEGKVAVEGVLKVSVCFTFLSFLFYFLFISPLPITPFPLLPTFLSPPISSFPLSSLLFFQVWRCRYARDGGASTELADVVGRLVTLNK